MHTIQINDDTYQLPQEWNELTPEQLRYLTRLTQTDMPVEQVKIHMLLYCLKAHVCRHKDIYKDYVRITVGQQSEKVCFRVRKQSYFLLPEEVNCLAELFVFLIRSESSKYHPSQERFYIHPELDKNPYPVLRCRLSKFTGPDDQLLDITFEQFMYLQTYLDAMHADPTQIDHLLACLWHRSKVFDINCMDKDAAILHHLPDDKKMILYWYILGSLSHIASYYPRVFSGAGGGSGRVFDAQLRLLDSLAQSDMTKKPEIRKGLLLDALYAMDESMRRKDEAEEKHNN